MAISGEHRSKLAAVHRQWWRLHSPYEWKILEFDEKNQTNKKQTYGNVNTAGEVLHNFVLCSVLSAFEQGVFVISSEGPPYLVAIYDTEDLS